MGDPNKQILVEDFFTYSTPNPFSNIAVGGNATQQIQIQADSDFLIQKLCYYTNTANVAQTANSIPIPNLSCIITDTGSGRQLMNTAIPVANIFGTGQNPFILPKPKLIAASSNLQIQVFNFDAAVATQQLYLAFIGVKIYYKSN